MELRALEIFAAVAKNKSFSAAARQLYTSHSTVCRAVAALEEELGVPLIERGNQVTGLTAAGAVLLEEAGHLLADAKTAAARVKAAGSEKEVERN